VTWQVRSARRILTCSCRLAVRRSHLGVPSPWTLRGRPRARQWRTSRRADFHRRHACLGLSGDRPGYGAGRAVAARGPRSRVHESSEARCDKRVGGSPAGLSASAGYFWTRYLATQVEIVFQIDDWNSDSFYETVYSSTSSGAYQVDVSQLKRNYNAGRGTVGQIVQFGHEGFRPYLSAGVGIESQSVVTSRHQYSESLLPGESPPPGAKTVSELPTTLPGPMETRRTGP
jgi:hypothetical protein